MQYSRWGTLISMSVPSQPPATPWITFLGHLLFILAAWTVFIKYLFPIGFALAEDKPIATYIFWDFWPLAHVWLGWALLTRPPYTRPLAIGMSAAEIAIIGTLLAQFLSNPEWTIWRTNWFINKVFVLSAFVMILATAATNPAALRGRQRRPGDSQAQNRR